jgi:hypothetical protein
MILGSGRMLGFLALVAASCLLFSCAGDAKPAPQEPTEAAPVDSLPEAVPASQTPTAENFDPAGVTAEVKTATFVDVRSLIDNLNQIIRQQDYDAWVGRLSNDYIKYYSDPSILAKYSEYPIMKRKGIVLKTLHDYFIHVVYPSRQNDKVDDIEFVGANQVKAITINSKGDRNILYMLEKHGDAWKIGIGR